MVEVVHLNDTADLTPGFFELGDRIVNHSDVPQSVRFIMFPLLEGFNGSLKCVGIPDTAVVWVSPELKIIVDSISTYIGGRNISCFGKSDGLILLRPVGGITAFDGYTDDNLTYVWNNGPSARDIFDLTAGLYTITVSDKLSCVDDSSFNLTQPEILTNSIKEIERLSCFGGDGIIGPNTHGGTPEYTYQWTKVPDDYHEELHDTLYSLVDGPYTLKVTDINGCQARGDTLVEYPIVAGVIAMADTAYAGYKIKCFGEASGELISINVGSPRPVVTYEWRRNGVIDTVYSNNLMRNYLYNRPAGTYKLTYTDEFGCSSYQTVELDQPQPVALQNVSLSSRPGGFNVSCYNSTDGNIKLNSITGGHGEPYQFNWETISGANIPDPTVRNPVNLGPGIYAVTVSDAFNCSVSDTFELSAPDEIVISSEVSSSITGNFNINCYGGNTGSIKLTASGGIPSAYQYRWQDDPTHSNERYNLAAGIYIVSVSDILGCTEIDTIILSQPGELVIDSLYISDYNGFGISCYGGSNGELYVEPEGGTGGYIYDWSYNGTILNDSTGHLSGIRAGNFSLKITDSNNCNLNWSGSLSEPLILDVDIAHTNVNCTGAVLGTATAEGTGGNGPYLFNWNSGQTTSGINNLNLGDYNVTITDANSCQAMDTVTILQNTEVIIDIEIKEQISCNGMSDGVLLAIATDGVEPYNYSWTNGGPASNTYTGLSEGTYTVTVIDNDGCEGSETIDLTDPEPLVPYFEVNDVSCFSFKNGTVSLDATGGNGNYRYYWDNNLLTNNEVNDLFAGNYFLTVQDEQNCQADTMIQINQPARLRIKIDEQSTVRPFCPDWQNGVLSLAVSGGTRNYTYSWDYSTGEQDSVITTIKEGWYEVTVTDAHGCVADSAFNLKALNDNCLSIPTAFTPDGNYANDFWEIRYMTETGAEVTFDVVYPAGEIKIYDRLGNLVYRCTGGCPEDWNGEDMHGRLLPVDTYYFLIDLNNGDRHEVLKGIVTIIR
jgi:gliding motility-associated-like protein